MTTSFRALRRANPRERADFAQSVAAAAEAVRARIDEDSRTSPPVKLPGHRFLRVSAAGTALAAVAAAAAFLTLGSPGGGPGVENAVAAVQRAATITAASAEQSGTATVRITHGPDLWAATTIRWHGDDMVIGRDARRPGRVADEMLVVDGILYGVDPEIAGGWIEFGSPESIDPSSGTTPAEYLAAVREDVGGVTLRRFSNGVSGLRVSQRADGATVYRGSVAAGLIAREIGFKGGQAIRVLPFGYVAHDEAADPASLLDVALTVAADGIVREISVTWGTGESAWAYTVAYSGLGTTAPILAPANATSLRSLREREIQRAP
jgi:putative intracellular protease/amidase